MKEWAKKRKQELEVIGAIELAEVFQLIVNLCELEEQSRGPHNPILIR
jgi:hypothetical protein